MRYPEISFTAKEILHALLAKYSSRFKENGFNTDHAFSIQAVETDRGFLLSIEGRDKDK